jgi:phospholipase D1/2
VIDEGRGLWKQYLTLLNLRHWEHLGNRPVTEQIYVHSKLLIADDRVAILGSANINDRSQLGDRDSELAVIVRGDTQVQVKLDGKNLDPVSSVVHDLRVRLWKKIFGLMGGANPATHLASLIDRPAAPETWSAIQETADANAIAYQNAFAFLPRVTGKSSSIWPTWKYDANKMGSYMPFNERFWRPAAVRDQSFTWDAKGIAKESAPSGVLGFLVALPTTWTVGENNASAMNLTMLAEAHNQLDDRIKMAGVDMPLSNGHENA